MSEESTTPDLEEAVRRSVDAFQRHDFDCTISIWAPDGIWDASVLGVGVFEGREAIRGFFEDWLRAYEEYEQVVEEFRDLGNGVTMTVLFQKGRPVGSAGYVQLQYASVGTWTDGLVERATIYTDIDQARTAAERLADERG
jgi:ketosteroid isomerase-like protein